jgi:shikimate kinase
MRFRGPLVITGFMGCGKSQVARALAQHFDLPLIDLDDKIATLHGRTAAQLIDQAGEAVFRAIETTTLSKLLQTNNDAVIALGGGAWITETNRELIAAHGGVAIWLDTPFAVCWQRIEASAEDRPLGRTRVQAEQLFNQRRPTYQLAGIHVTVMDHERVSDTVARIEAALSSYEVN